jgi:hypothetical protein
MDKEQQAIEGVIDALKDLDILSAYRVISIIEISARAEVKKLLEQLGDDAERAKAALDDMLEGIKEDEGRE